MIYFITTTNGYEIGIFAITENNYDAEDINRNCLDHRGWIHEKEGELKDITPEMIEEIISIPLEIDSPHNSTHRKKEIYVKGELIKEEVYEI